MSGIIYMPILFRELDDFVFSEDLLRKIRDIDHKKCTVATRYSRRDYIKSLRQYHKLSCFDIARRWGFAYGFLFSASGTIDSLYLPESIEQQVANQLVEKLGKSVVDDSVIRLQLIYGNRLIPPHVDITRTASLIYPVTNHNQAATVFFGRNKEIGPEEQVFLMDEIFERDRITIDSKPVLFDTKKIHAVVFPYPIPEKNPRVSITVKWKTLTVDRILDSMIQI